MIINVSVHAPPVVSTVLSVPRRVNVSKSSRREQTAKELIQCIYYPISPLKLCVSFYLPLLHFCTVYVGAFAVSVPGKEGFCR